MELTAEKKIDRAHYYIMNSPIWVGYSGVIMVGKVEIADDIPTAYTDGWNIKYGRAFIESLTEPEVRMVVLHENLHKMFCHLRIWKQLFMQDARKANIAADYFVNLTIEEAGDPGVVMPKIGIQPDKKYHNMSVGEIYHKLPPSPPPQPCPFCASGEEHPPMQTAPPGQGDIECEQGHGGFDQHDWDKGNEPNAEEQRRRTEEIDQAIRQGAIMAGKLAGNKPRGFDELMEVKIDWKEVLRQFISAACRGGDRASFRRPSRKWLQFDMIMPSTITETLDTVLFGIDTSGSIQGEALNEFVSCGVACLEQVNPNRVDLLYWDAAVAAHEVYWQNDAGRMLTSTKPAGGGGTAPSCITTYMKKHKIVPTCCVILSDGYTGSDYGGEWPCPVLWVIKDNPSFQPNNGGAVVHF